MDRIKKYVEYDQTNYNENKILTIIYSLFTFFFVFIPCILHIVFDRASLLLILIPCAYFLVGFLLVIRLFITKKSNSVLAHYTLQSTLLFSLTALFLCVPIVNIYAYRCTFSWIHAISVLLGGVFASLICYFRYEKWLVLMQQKKPRKTNPKTVALIGAGTFILMSVLSILFKSMEGNIFRQIVEGGVFILAFVFFALFIISLSNIYILKKYILK